MPNGRKTRPGASAAGQELLANRNAEIVRLWNAEGLSYSTIAGRFQLSRSAVAKIIQHWRKRNP